MIYKYLLLKFNSTGIKNIHFSILMQRLVATGYRIIGNIKIPTINSN